MGAGADRVGAEVAVGPGPRAEAAAASQVVLRPTAARVFRDAVE